MWVSNKFANVTSQNVTRNANAQADITIYPLKSIWSDKVIDTKPQYVGTTFPTDSFLFVGGCADLNAYILPIGVSQEIDWSVKDNSDVLEVTDKGQVTALKTGSATVVAASRVNPELKKEFNIKVNKNGFDTNISEFSKEGSWILNEDGLTINNGATNDFYMSNDSFGGDFEMTTNMRLTRGLVNIFIASSSTDPFADGGAYTIQFNEGMRVRLFPFGNDDYATGVLDNDFADGKYRWLWIVLIAMAVVLLSGVYVAYKKKNRETKK